MNEIVNKFLLAGDKFMPQMHLRSFNYFVIKKVINTVQWTYVISNFNGEETVGARERA